MTGRTLQARLLVVSALHAEQAVLRRRLGAPAGRLVRARENVFVGLTGDGAAPAAERLGHFIRQARPDGILVIGLCGGLSPDLEPGALLFGREVRAAFVAPGGSTCELETAQVLDPWPASGARPACLVSAPRLVATPAEKRSLWLALGEPPSAGVDLESAALCQVARQVGCRIFILRAVSDGFDEALPRSVVTASDASGRVRPWQVALRASLRPTSWPSLQRLRARVQVGAVRLAEAVEDGLSRGLTWSGDPGETGPRSPSPPL